MGVRRDVLVASAGAALLLVLGALAFAGGAGSPERQGRVIAIDFSESIDSRIVHPMERDHDDTDHPAAVHLRFAGGREYHNDHASLVAIRRGDPDAPYFIDQVIVGTSYASIEDAVSNLRRLQLEWRLREVDPLEEWIDRHTRSGTTAQFRDPARGGLWNIADAKTNGRRLTIEYELTADHLLTKPYWLSVTFSW